MTRRAIAIPMSWRCGVLGIRCCGSRLSFGAADLLMEKLGVTPGSVTAFAVILWFAFVGLVCQAFTILANRHDVATFQSVAGAPIDHHHLVFRGISHGATVNRNNLP